MNTGRLGDVGDALLLVIGIGLISNGLLGVPPIPFKGEFFVVFGFVLLALGFQSLLSGA